MDYSVGSNIHVPLICLLLHIYITLAWSCEMLAPVKKPLILDASMKKNVC
uniref:Uncharacterized protein n=1 Tax=Arundo donax TaxID=35708 RepID=A0A0A9AFH4_ARUDO